MRILLSLFVFTFILISCDKEDKKQFDCDNFTMALINYNDTIAREEMIELTHDLASEPIQSDILGHKENLDILVERLNKKCDEILASKLCYACIETNPPISEISIELDSLGTMISRVIDIDTPSNKDLKFHRIHN